MAKKNKEMLDLKGALKSKKIPILTLDNRWHELFPEYDKTPRIKELETKVNNLVKEQGKLVNDMKDMKRLKAKLMKEIVENMDISGSPEGKRKEKKLDMSQRLIKDINDKMAQSEDRLVEVPYLIKEANEQLMIESMKQCYARLTENKEQEARLGEWIKRAREELKNNILIKQDLEIKSEAIYSYMHDLLGAEVTQLFDDNQAATKE